MLGGSSWDCECGGVGAGSSVGIAVTDAAIAKDFQESTLRLSSALIRRSPRTNVVETVMDGCCSRERLAFFPHLGRLR